MTELNAYEWELDGLLLDATNGFGVISTSGLEDGADVSLDQTQRWSDGTSTGNMRLTDRLVTLTLGITADTTEAQKDALRTVMSPKANRLAKRTLRFRHRAGTEGSPTLTRRVDYVPAAGKAITVPGDRAHLTYGWSDAITLRLQVDDPYIYSDAYETTSVTTATPGSPTEIDVTNEGTTTAVVGAPPGTSLGVYQWSITAGGSGCTWPFVRNKDFPGEFWYLAEDIGTGGVISVSWERLTRRNTTVRYATVKGPDGCPIPIWPALRPGLNTLEFGCFSGSITGTFYHRSTW